MYVAPAMMNAAAPPMAHHTIGEIPLVTSSMGGSAGASTGCVATAAGAAASGTSKLNSEGTTALSVEETERNDSLARLETTAAGIGASSAAQPSGGVINTMLPHFGQARIWPMASGLRTLSRERQVSQVTRKGSKSGAMSGLSRAVRILANSATSQFG
jgi:hypothetical protein